tara:strand:+ start:2482 stop:2799 length:318 start_codon:yes stop_codon:yes gene_type:complete
MREPKIIKRIKKTPPLVEGAIGLGVLVAPTDPVSDVVALGLIADATRRTPGGKKIVKGVKKDIKDVKVAKKEIVKIYPKDLHVAVKTLEAAVPDKTIKAISRRIF